MDEQKTCASCGGHEFAESKCSDCGADEPATAPAEAPAEEAPAAEETPAA